MVNKKKIEPFFYLLPAFVVTITITAYPFIYNVLLSFQEWNLTSLTGKHFVGGQNYLRIFRNPDVWNSLRITGIYLVACVGFEFILGLAIAFLIHSEFRGKTVVRALLLFPMIMSPVIAGLIWRWIFNAEWGLANYMISLIRLSTKPWLVKPRLALFSVILADIWQWTPFIMLIILAGLHAIPKQLIEAAGIDGASWWQIQRYISLPILKPILLIGLSLRTIDGLGIVDKIYAITYGGPGSATSVLGFFTYIKAFKFFQMGRAAALSVILLAIVIFSTSVFIRLFRETQ